MHTSTGLFDHLKRASSRWRTPSAPSNKPARLSSSSSASDSAVAPPWTILQQPRTSRNPRPPVSRPSSDALPLTQLQGHSPPVALAAAQSPRERSPPSCRGTRDLGDRDHVRRSSSSQPWALSGRNSRRKGGPDRTRATSPPNTRRPASRRTAQPYAAERRGMRRATSDCLALMVRSMAIIRISSDSGQSTGLPRLYRRRLTTWASFSTRRLVEPVPEDSPRGDARSVDDRAKSRLSS